MKKKYRIKKNQEIEAIIKLKQTVGDPYFVIYTQPLQVEHFRFAVSVGKKFGNAPERNLAKRRVREIVRAHQGQTPSKDFFIVIKPKSKGLKYAEMYERIHTLLKRAKVLKG